MDHLDKEKAEDERHKRPHRMAFSMFAVIKPQKFVHSDGFTIQIADRETVEYIENGTVWQVSVDFGKTVGMDRPRPSGMGWAS